MTSNAPDRRLVLRSGIVGLGLGSSALALGACDRVTAPEPPGPSAGAGAGAADGARARARDFRGARQAGIIERPQAHAAFIALDLPQTATKDTLRRLLTVWTDDIERIMEGRAPLTDLEPELAAAPASITVTVGVGARPVGLSGRPSPPWLAPLPPFPIDRLDPRWAGGDLVLQICSDSPTTLAHSQRRLLAGAGDLARVRWVQRGFREPFEGPDLPMRNLFGQVDGTIQPALDGADDDLLWVGSAGPQWLRDGSALVLRRIEMDLDEWDRVDRAARENAIGRRLDTGAPVSASPGAAASTPPDLSVKDAHGFPLIDDASHLRRAQPRAPGERFLRRPYSYDEPPQPGATSSSGLLFAAFCADPLQQFVPVQERLSEKDLLNIWTTPIGSAVFAILPGAQPGEILGQRLVTG